MTLELGLYRPQPREADVSVVMVANTQLAFENMTEDDDCTLRDPEWEHLALLYEILLDIVGKEE